MEKLSRDILPIPDSKHVGLTTYDAKDPHTKYPPIRTLRPPEGAPNVLIVLIDDAGFGSSWRISDRRVVRKAHTSWPRSNSQPTPPVRVNQEN